MAGWRGERKLGPWILRRRILGLTAALVTTRNEEYNPCHALCAPSRRSAVQGLCLLSVLLLVQGRPCKAPPVGIRFPITHGSHSILPTAQQRILLSGDLPWPTWPWNGSDPSLLEILMPEKGPSTTCRFHTVSQTARRHLLVAKEMKAEFVVFVEREESKEGALIEPQCGSLFHVSVNVRGLSVETGDTAFRGSAHYPHLSILAARHFGPDLPGHRHSVGISAIRATRYSVQSDVHSRPDRADTDPLVC